MLTREEACEDLFCNFINHMSKWYGRDVTDCVVCFADGIELHYHDDGSDEDEEA